MDPPLPLEPDYVKSKLASPPFVEVEGVVNIRSLGSYPSQTRSDFITKPNFMFRSGAIGNITESGKKKLYGLGVRKIFDLRSEIETVKFGRPPPEMSYGIEIRRTPIFNDEDYSPENLTVRSKQYTSRDVKDLMEIYDYILIGSVPALKVITSHIITNPDEGFLFHCTAGKDRTGVISGLLLKLAGVSDADIAEEYALSRIGMEPKREETIQKLLKLDDYAGDPPGLLWSLDSRPASMMAFIELLESKYGGAEAFLKSLVELSDEEISLMKENLLVPAEIGEAS